MLVNFIRKNHVVLLFGLLLLLVYFPVFLQLDYMPIRMWDESMLGINAIEMGKNHNYIVTYFNGKPEMWNTKPPLAVWCILLFSKMFGFSEISLRLPSAIAALALCIFLFFALRKYTGNALFGFFTVCVLITCRGFIRNHVTRTGEYDSMLVLFSTGASVCLFLAVEALQNREQSKYLFWFFVMLTLAVLTKGVAGLMQLPGLLIYVFLRKKTIILLRNKAFYYGLAPFIIFGVGYYFLRESVNHGYLNAIWDNELGGRYAGTKEGHIGSFSFYLNEIISWQFINYYLLFPAAVIVGLGFSEGPVRRLVGFALITGLSFLFIISLAATKLPHYDAPAFPYLAIITASLFYGIYRALRAALENKWNFLPPGALAFFIILGLLAKPYSDIISTVYFPKGDWWEEGFSKSCKYLQKVARGDERLLTHKLADVSSYPQYGSSAVLNSYKEEIIEHGIPFSIVDTGQIQQNDTVLVFNDGVVRQQLQQKFKLVEIEHLDNYDVDYIRMEPKD